jgi:hypothetical protein
MNQVDKLTKIILLIATENKNLFATPDLRSSKNSALSGTQQ